MSDLQKEKENEYKEYIGEHISNVAKAYYELFPELKHVYNELNDEGNKRKLMMRIISHDQSKYNVVEFDAYRRHFYPISPDEKNDSEDDFERAWEHHYTVNDHHWNYWFNKETKECKPMEFLAIIELVCDWAAMGYKFGNNPKQYYEENKDLIQLHPDTRKQLEEILFYLYK